MEEAFLTSMKKMVASNAEQVIHSWTNFLEYFIAFFKANGWDLWALIRNMDNVFIIVQKILEFFGRIIDNLSFEC